MAASPVERSLPRFPGGTSVSGLCVYDWETADGLHGGSPHLHTLSTEAYVVTSGHGEVHTLSSEGAAQDPLQPGSLLWFTPGTVHRLVNHKDLELNLVMSNAGPPEAGDAVLTFPAEILADPEKYAAAAALPADADADADDEDRAKAARVRRDLAIEGYEELLAEVAERGPGALDPLYRAAVNLVRPKTDHWRRIWEDNVLAETQRTQAQLEALAADDGTHLKHAAVVRGDQRPQPRLYGMCGRLQTWTGEQPPHG